MGTGSPAHPAPQGSGALRVCAIRPQLSSFPAASNSQGSHLLLQLPVPPPGQGTALAQPWHSPHAQRPVTTLCLSFYLKPAAKLWETWIFWVLDLVPTSPNHSCCSGWRVKKQKGPLPTWGCCCRHHSHNNHREQLMLQTACNSLQMLYLTVFIGNNVPYVRTKKKPQPIRHLSLH